jgi:hypothetical protein
VPRTASAAMTFIIAALICTTLGNAELPSTELPQLTIPTNIFPTDGQMAEKTITHIAICTDERPLNCVTPSKRRTIRESVLSCDSLPDRGHDVEELNDVVSSPGFRRHTTNTLAKLAKSLTQAYDILITTIAVEHCWPDTVDPENHYPERRSPWTEHQRYGRSSNRPPPPVSPRYTWLDSDMPPENDTTHTRFLNKACVAQGVVSCLFFYRSSRCASKAWGKASDTHMAHIDIGSHPITWYLQPSGRRLRLPRNVLATAAHCSRQAPPAP